MAGLVETLGKGLSRRRFMRLGITAAVLTGCRNPSLGKENDLMPKKDAFFLYFGDGGEVQFLENAGVFDGLPVEPIRVTSIQKDKTPDSPGTIYVPRPLAYYMDPETKINVFQLLAAGSLNAIGTISLLNKSANLVVKNDIWNNNLQENGDEMRNFPDADKNKSTILTMLPSGSDKIKNGKSLPELMVKVTGGENHPAGFFTTVSFNEQPENTITVRLSVDPSSGIETSQSFHFNDVVNKESGEVNLSDLVSETLENEERRKQKSKELSSDWGIEGVETKEVILGDNFNAEIITFPGVEDNVQTILNIKNKDGKVVSRFIMPSMALKRLHPIDNVNPFTLKNYPTTHGGGGEGITFKDVDWEGTLHDLLEFNSNGTELSFRQGNEDVIVKGGVYLKPENREDKSLNYLVFKPTSFNESLGGEFDKLSFVITNEGPKVTNERGSKTGPVETQLNPNSNRKLIAFAVERNNTYSFSLDNPSLNGVDEFSDYGDFMDKLSRLMGKSELEGIENASPLGIFDSTLTGDEYPYNRRVKVMVK